MADYIQTRTQLRGERMVEALKKRNIEACYVATKEEALAQALRWIPEGSSVGWGGSVSIDEIGLKDAIRQGNYVALDRDVAPTPEEKDRIMHDILSADYFITSANAIAEDGTMVNIDGLSNRLAAMCYGPSHVLYIIGMNKVVSSPEDAYQRARTEAAPINALPAHRLLLRLSVTGHHLLSDSDHPSQPYSRPRQGHSGGRIPGILTLPMP